MNPQSYGQRVGQQNQMVASGQLALSNLTADQIAKRQSIMSWVAAAGVALGFTAGVVVGMHR